MLQEVEKEVVLLDQNPDEHSSELLSSEPLTIDMNSSEKALDTIIEMVGDAAAPVDRPQVTSSNGHRVLKVIRKVEVQILCTQHNPVRQYWILHLNLS